MDPVGVGLMAVLAVGVDLAAVHLEEVGDGVGAAV